jgi:hypothetical protein
VFSCSSYTHKAEYGVGPTELSLHSVCKYVPVTVAERSQACTVFARSEAGTVGSNSMFGVCMRLFCVCVVLCLCRGFVTS